MNYPKQRREFTISEISRACGVSRKTLIRMEECGFLTPYRVNPDTGYRYYDAHNASEVGQFLLLQTLGLSRAEITDCYYNTRDMKDFLQEQKERLSRMQRVLEELEIRSSKTSRPMSSFLDLPEIVCYCAEKKLSSPEDGELFHYTVHEECIAKGYRLLGQEPIFAFSSDDYRSGIYGNQEATTTTACIPVAESVNDDPNLRVFPATRAFSMLAYGDYSVIHDMCLQFWKEIDARGIRPTGPVRFIGVVAPYVGKHIKKDNFCYRMVAPI
ncbi:MAG: MerR family transcriptional regulator [Lachnospiraceae bacterium]|nr:MerR family transcriptional regulator [Lachnospiraceae bacterium]